MNITAEEIKEAQAILRRWYSFANLKNNAKAAEEVKLIMRVLSGLYTG